MPDGSGHDTGLPYVCLIPNDQARKVDDVENYYIYTGLGSMQGNIEFTRTAEGEVYVSNFEVNEDELQDEGYELALYALARQYAEENGRTFRSDMENAATPAGRMLQRIVGRGVAEVMGPIEGLQGTMAAGQEQTAPGYALAA